MRDTLLLALDGLGALDPDETAQLLRAFGSIADASNRADVIAFAEALADIGPLH